MNASEKRKRKELNEIKLRKIFSYMQTQRIVANKTAKVPDIVRTKSQIFHSLFDFFFMYFCLFYFVTCDQALFSFRLVKHSGGIVVYPFFYFVFISVK